MQVHTVPSVLLVFLWKLNPSITQTYYCIVCFRSNQFWMHSTSIHGLSSLPQTLVTRILLPSKQTANISNQDSFAAALTACINGSQKHRNTTEKQQENIFIWESIIEYRPFQVSLQRCYSQLGTLRWIITVELSNIKNNIFIPIIFTIHKCSTWQSVHKFNIHLC